MSLLIVGSLIFVVLAIKYPAGPARRFSDEAVAYLRLRNASPEERQSYRANLRDRQLERTQAPRERRQERRARKQTNAPVVLAAERGAESPRAGAAARRVMKTYDRQRGFK